MQATTTPAGRASRAAIVTAEFDGHQMQFRADGWFNATVAAAKYGKRPGHWLELPGTCEFIAGLDRRLNAGKSGIWVKTTRGATGGTWLHPKLAVKFAQWLDVDFDIWCSEQIDALLRGHADRSAVRVEVKEEHKALMALLRISRELDGKPTERHHYINEARVCRYALTGSDEPWIRDELTAAELALLADVERLEAVLMIRGVPYTERKTACRTLALSQHHLLGATA